MEGDIGEFVRSKRLAKGMSIRQVALYAGCSDSYLSMIERGIRVRPTPDILRKLAKPLSVPYETLLLVAGYDLERGQPEKPRTIVQALRESIGLEKEEFAIYLGLSLGDVEQMEYSNVSIESVEVVFEKIFSPQRSLTANHKLLIHGIEGMLSTSDSIISGMMERVLGGLLESGCPRCCIHQST